MILFESKMKNPLVSLVIPAYNVEELIGMTLNSILEQTLIDFECIIVDDFSTDKTNLVIKDYLRKDKRFKLINHRANAGLSAARNTGLRFSKGKYIAFLDSDDLIMPESLELRAKTLDTADDNMVIGTYAGSITIDMNCRKPPKSSHANLRMVDFVTAAGNCPFNANQPMFINNVFKKFGGFDHSLKQAEDYDMWMRVLRYGFKIIPTQRNLITYRQAEGSMVRRNPLLHLDNSYNNFINCYKEYPVENWNDNFDKLLTDGIDKYISQINIANRVLEFIGLSLAKGEPKEELLKRLLCYLPNYFDIVEYHRDFILNVRKGINRYFNKNVDINLPENFNIKNKIENIYFDFKRKSFRKNDFSLPDGLKYTSNDIVRKSNIQANIDVIFFPHKDYHVQAINLMKPYLDELEVSFIVVDIAMHYRDEGVFRSCVQYDLPQVGYSNFVLGNFKPKVLICFNDWDPILRSILIAAKKSNIPTIGIVEGIQDYDDADTKQNRRAYRTVDHLFLPGRYDKKYFENSSQDIYIGGVPRIYDMYNSREKIIKNESEIALINSNFSYGVLEEYRDEWLQQAVSVCLRAGYKPIISRHPADKGVLYPELVTKDDFYTALKKSKVIISRFASGILEAAAIGVLPIYFNPHNEKVDKFYENHSSYPITDSESTLFDALINYKVNFDLFLKNRVGFIEHHCGPLSLIPQEQISIGIFNILKKVKMGNIVDFNHRLSEIDRISGCFNNVQILRDDNFRDGIKEGGGIENSNLVIGDFYEAIKKKDFHRAENIYIKLSDSDRSNPVYKYMKEIIYFYKG